MDAPNDATEVRSAGASPIAAFARGQRLNDRYLIEEAIGSGGFGAVFRAHDEMLGRVVALKTLSSRREGSSGANDPLIEEARTVARLDHPNIVPIYDVGVTDSIPWMAMKLIEGTSLDHILAHEKRFDRARAISIAAQAAQALDHAHRRGIVHRDVKPSNILVSRLEDGSEHAWLADFGIAKILTGNTVSESLVAGTPSYMAPEQITGKRVDARTDIFALGCITAEMLSGKRCFPGTNFTQLMYKIVHDIPDGLSDVAMAAGPELEATVRRALAKSPEDRFHTVAEFRAQLLQPASPPRLTITQRLRRRTEPAWDGRDVLVSDGLYKSYGRKSEVIRGLDLRIERGSIYALLGRNGSGKTTLIRTLLGLYRRDRGRVSIFGRDPQRDGPAILGRIGYVQETLPVYDTLRVREFFHLMERTYPDWDERFAYGLLLRYKLPLEERIKTLSRGKRTQLALVAALSHRPEFLVLDDPTLGLDAVVLDDFFMTLAETSKREGTTVLIASHNMAELETVATHVGLLGEGRIILSDTLEGLRVRTREVTATFEDDVPAHVHDIVGLKTIRESGRRLTAFVLDESSGAIESLQALRPSSVNIRELSLKEIFVNFMRDEE
jgi:ABC-type multidrug transport system ATPase subunit